MKVVLLTSVFVGADKEGCCTEQEHCDRCCEYGVCACVCVNNGCGPGGNLGAHTITLGHAPAGY